MRQKRKARGIAERAAAQAEALAVQAGDALEIVEDEETAPEAEAHAAAEPEAEAEATEADAEPPEPEAEQAAIEPEKHKALLEALLFASDKPLTVQRLRQLTKIPDLPRIQALVDEIQADFADRGMVLQEVSGGYLFRTHHAYSTWVQQLIQGRPVRLSRAQLETLSIVAYRQPITRPEIDQIRGVDSGATLKLLLDRHLIRILGKKEEPGRPLLYGTTKEFLDFFSLKDLRELPTLREYSELSEENQQLVEKHHPPSVDVEAAVAQAKIDHAVAVADALHRNPGEILTDLPDEPPADELESADDAAP
jgi:segregation and condensation protein B